LPAVGSKSPAAAEFYWALVRSTVTNRLRDYYGLRTSFFEMKFSCWRSFRPAARTGLEVVRGWNAAEAVHPDDLPEVIAVWRRSVETEEPYEIEHRMRRFDGVYRWLHVRALPLKDAKGRVARWYCL